MIFKIDKSALTTIYDIYILKNFENVCKLSKRNYLHTKISFWPKKNNKRQRK